MTRNANLKQRIRARMAKTGERYTAARAQLLAQLEARATGRTRRWVSEPEVDDASVSKATGHAWEHWCQQIESAGLGDAPHPQIAAWLYEHTGLSRWWSQTVTVGYERISGRRLPHQRADGLFAVGRSRTVRTDVQALRDALLDERERADLLPGHPTELRSKPDSRDVRLAIGPGVAIIRIDVLADGRARLAVDHCGLPDSDTVEYWRHWWGEWLEALEGTSPLAGAG